MRILILGGSLFLALGAFLFTRGTGWSWWYMIPGALVMMWGIVTFALAAKFAKYEARHTAKVRSRVRGRASTGRSRLRFLGRPGTKDSWEYLPAGK